MANLTVTINETSFDARAGDVLLDAALAAGIDMPHDCRSGHCGTCLLRLRQGRTLGGESRQPGHIHACQARVFGDIAVEMEPVPTPGRMRGRLVRLIEVGQDIAELTIRCSEPVTYLPGQYFRFRFRGFPSRCFSPTFPLKGNPRPGTLRLNVKRVRNGRVTQAIGARIDAGHPVLIEGPFGHAFLRPNQQGRLVLVGTGTGFAPVWAIAVAALKEQPDRPIVMVASAPRLEQLYMAPALARLAGMPNVGIIAATEEPQSASTFVRLGSAADHLPPLAASDIVYAAGTPAVVEAVAAQAGAAGATFFADPFDANPPDADSFMVLLQRYAGNIRRRLESWHAAAPGLDSGADAPKHGTDVAAEVIALPARRPAPPVQAGRDHVRPARRTAG